MSPSRRLLLALAVASPATWAVVTACSSFGGSAGDTPWDGASVDGPGVGDSAAGDSGDGASIACDAGAPTPEKVAEDPDGVGELAADDSHVYWTSVSHVSGASAQKPFVVDVMAQDAGAPVRVALTQNSVFFVTSASALILIPKLGGAATSVDTLGPSLLAGTSDTLYYGWSGGIRKAPNSAGTHNDLVTAVPNPTALSAGGGYVAFVAVIGTPSASSLAWLPSGAHQGSYNFTVVATDVGGEARIANDDTTIWVTKPGAGQIVTYPRSDGGAPTVFVSKAPGVGALVADELDLFYSTGIGVFRIAKAGGCIARVSDAPSQGLAVTSSYVYFVRNGKEVVRVAR